MKNKKFWTVVITVVMSVMIGMSIGPREALAKNSVVAVSSDAKTERKLKELLDNMEWYVINRRPGDVAEVRIINQLIRKTADGRYVYAAKAISEGEVIYETHNYSPDELVELALIVEAARDGRSVEF